MQLSNSAISENTRINFVAIISFSIHNNSLGSVGFNVLLCVRTKRQVVERQPSVNNRAEKFVSL